MCLVAVPFLWLGEMSHAVKASFRRAHLRHRCQRQPGSDQLEATVYSEGLAYLAD